MNFGILADDMILESAKHASLDAQIEFYRKYPSIRGYFQNNVNGWNLDEDFFISAMERKDMKNVAFILRRFPITGADGIRSDENYSLLQFIVEYAEYEDIRIILRHTAQSHIGVSILISAIGNRDDDIIKLIISNMSRTAVVINAIVDNDDVNMDILHFALNKGFSTNIEYDQKYPLDIVMERNDIPAMKMLLRYNSDPNILLDNKSYLDISIINRNLIQIKLLLEHGGIITTPLTDQEKDRLIRENQWDILQLLEDYKVI